MTQETTMGAPAAGADAAATTADGGARGRRIVMLDVDGTLVESAPGILASVRHAFEELGYDVPDAAALNRFIGPPLVETFASFGMDAATADEATAAYRRVYANPSFPDPDRPGELIEGRLLGGVYDGVKAMIGELKARGCTVVTATAKPEAMAFPVLDHFGLTPLVDAVYGATLDRSRNRKPQVIAYALDALGYDPAAGDRAVMVGDRDNDVDGARDNGLDCIGCRWGYAEGGELEAHGAVAVAETPADLPDAVDAYFA
ncbi:HAD hydrolase-like protein [Bifidobacterium samirii]|uniref:Haloacid dehalogenase n=1 Tax=Bifidobacterium samirii TaxID=2306974 RepID=A0A430FX12_9BIFI|nr:HAD hydrolase-like protein [Bifidobacterium samirii]RSX58758.1 haloacid dehalogenase [Bifidobacterium samirii]